MDTASYHIPVLLRETVDALVLNSSGSYLDCTLGGGGHSEAILKAIDREGTVLGIDRDAEAIAEAGRKLGSYKNFRSENISFSRINELEQIVFGLKFDGILLDLGVSSKQIDDPKRGFSYSSEGRLDMRMDAASGISAYEVVNTYSGEELKKIFYSYGEEKNSRRIAEKIVSEREKSPIATTKELTSIISSVVSGNFRTKTLSRVFQALRIEVNAELEELKTVLEFSLDILKKGGRTAVISYHSLEDRIVKNFIAEHSAGCICPKEFPRCLCDNKPSVRNLTKKPVTASEEEISTNPRSRSAKLRIYEKII
jgi:16S rRNA (cytosine1402-N4)-methyltransferase